MEHIVRMSGITKDFAHVRAIDNGYFDLLPGEIHSLIGENGAGKSTMMKILYGLYRPDEGEISVKGESVAVGHNPHRAIDLGIGMVHQEFMLVKEMTVLENIILGFEPTKRGGRINFDEGKKEINKYIEAYHMNVQQNKKVLNISVGEAQRVEIIKTLYRGADILILDEPTAVLTPQESVKLFEILNLMKEQGKTVIFISHKLKEVMAISDRITIMRRGKYVDTVRKAETSMASLAKLMVGREVFLNIDREVVPSGKTVLEVKDIYIPGETELSKIRSVSFDIKEGEVLGVAGVDGNGQQELVEALAGIRKIEQGEVRLNGERVDNLSPLRIRRKGMSHIPEDRNARGLNKEYTIFENLVANKFRGKPFSKRFFLQQEKISEFGEELIKKFDIRPANGRVLSGSLSGGNAQKIVVAREVAENACLLMAAQPTRGVDVGSIESIRGIINLVKRNKTSVLLVSADLDEILSLSDRIIVLFEGKISGEIRAEEATEEKLGLLMTGGTIRE